MPSQFYYRSEGKKLGPISASDIRQLAASGAISPDTPIRKGNSPWIAAKNIGGLSFAAKPNPALHSPFTDTITDLPSAAPKEEPEAFNPEPAATEPQTFDSFEPESAAPARELLAFEPDSEPVAGARPKPRFRVGKKPSQPATPRMRLRSLRWLAWILIVVGVFCFILAAVNLLGLISTETQTNAAVPIGQADAAKLSRSVAATTFSVMTRAYFAAALHFVALGGFMLLLLEIEQHLRKQLPVSPLETPH